MHEQVEGVEQVDPASKKFTQEHYTALAKNVNEMTKAIQFGGVGIPVNSKRCDIRSFRF